MQEGELSGHVPGAPEACKDRRIGNSGGRIAFECSRVVQDPHDLVSAVGLVHEGLHGIRRKIDVPRRTGRAERRGARNDRNSLHERACGGTRALRVNVDSILAAIARIH